MISQEKRAEIFIKMIYAPDEKTFNTYYYFLTNMKYKSRKAWELMNKVKIRR